MTRFPLSRAAVAAFFCFISAVALHGQAPAISSTKVDALSTDTDGDTKADPLDVIQYTIGISNTGTASATGTTFTDPTPTNTTLIGTSVNVSPVAIDDAYPLTVLPNIGINTNTSSEFSVVTNDFKGFVGGNAVAVGDAALTITSVGATTGGGTVVMTTSGADIGKFTYTPAPGFTGTDTFTYTISNSAGGDAPSRTATVSISVAGNVIWFVNSTGAAGDGRLATPFNSLAAFQAVNNGTGNNPAANDFVFLFENATDYTGSVTLLNGQRLIGQDATATLGTIASVTPSVDSTALPVTNSGNATKTTLTTTVASTNAINLGSGNTVRGLTVGNTTGTDIIGTAVGSLSVSDVTLSGTGQAFVVSTSGALAVTIDSLSSSSGTNGVNLTGCSGTFTATAGTINGPTGDDFVVSGGMVVVNSAATITNTAGRSVNIANKTASGNVSFTGAISDTGTGILLDNNDGATVSFTGGLSLNTGANTAFAATNGGTVTATQNNTSIVNSLTSTTATALVVTNTNIGAAGLTFRSISANGAPNGILLNTTGTSGGLAVTGNGTAASGGTIQATTGAGISLNSTVNVSLSRMQISNTGAEGITAFNMSDPNTGDARPTFELLNSRLTSPGDADNENAIAFGTDALNGNNSGRVVFTNVIVEQFEENGLVVTNNTNPGGQTLTVDVTGTLSGLTDSTTKFDDNNDTHGQQGIFVRADGTADIQLNVSGVYFNNIESAAIDARSGGSTNASIDLNLTGNVSINGGGPDNFPSGGGFQVIQDVGSTATYDIQGNNIRDLSGDAIVIIADGQSEGRIGGTNPADGNVISGTVLGDGIRIDTEQLPGGGNNFATTILIQNNNIGNDATFPGIGDDGIQILHRDGTKTLNLTITNNTIANTSVANGGEAIRYFQDADVSDGALKPYAAVRVANNTFTNIGTADALVFITQDTADLDLHVATNTLPAAGNRNILVSQTGASVLQITQASVAALAAANTNATASALGTITFSSTVTNPPLPANPLLFAPAEPEAAGLGTPDSVLSAVAWTEKVRLRSAAVPPVSSSAGVAPATDEAPGGTPGIHTGGTPVLQQTQLDSLVTAARTRWAASGLSAAQLAALDNVKFEVADLPGWYLGEAAGKTVRVDSDAGGNGWFIDATPMEDGEFGGARRDANIELSTLNIELSKLAEGRVDLLTTILHEMGHAIGLCDTYSKLQRSSVMYGFLNKGERRLPKTGEAAGATPHAHMTPHFLSSPITIGTLPVGKSVTITYQTTVNGPTLPLGTFEISNQGTVSGGNFANVLTDDPSVGGATDPTVTPVDRPDTTVASINRAGSNPTNANSVSWTVTFADAIINLATSNFSLVNGGLVAPSLTSATAVGGTPATQWTVTASTGTGNGTLGLNMANDTGLSHDVTNLTFTGQVYNIDKTPPTVTINQAVAQADPTNAAPINFTVVFNEAVSDFDDAGDVTLTGTAGATTINITGGPTTYNVAVSGMTGPGTVIATVPAGVAIDVATNLNAPSSSTDNTVTFDNAPPTVTINQAVAQADPTTTAPINFTVVFNEAVTDFDDAADLSYSGTAPGVLSAVITGGPTTYNVAVSGMTGSGTVIASVVAGAAVDAVLNPSQASTSTDNTVTFNQPPAITNGPPPSPAVVGTAYNFAYTASGNPAPTFGVTSGALPPGLALGAAGVISGTPSVAGTFAGTVTASNGALPNATQNFSIVVNQAPAFTNGPPPSPATQTVPYSFTFTATGSPAPTFSVTAGALPTSLSLSGAGAITGTPSATGTFTGTITATNSAGTATQNFSITVNPPGATTVTASMDDGVAQATRKNPGDPITYSIAITNTGATTATSVLYTNPDPANTTFVSVNSTPIARNDAYNTIGNVQITVPAGTGLLVNDNDPDGIGAAPTVTAINTAGTQGNVTFAADGSFTFNPTPAFTGTTTFSYTITDNEGTTDTGTVTINVAGRIWFINAAAGAGGDGRLTTPFNTIAAFNSTAADVAGDNIFLYSGTYTTPPTLLTNERLIGQGATASITTITGLAVPSGNAVLPATGGARPTIAVASGTGITLVSGNTITGLNVTNSNGSGITGSAVGTLTLADFDVTVTGGTALSLTTSGTVTATGTDNDLSSTNGTALNVASVNIGAANLTFKSISSGTAAGSAGNGITLDTTGALGGLIVTGAGTAGSGGTIRNKTGADASTTAGIGIYLNSTSNVSLSRMQLNDFDNFAIRGTSVTGFTLADSVVNGTHGVGAVAANDEGAVSFTNLLGSAAITNSTVANTNAGGGAEVVLRVTNNTGTLNRLTVSGSTIANSNAVPGTGDDAMLFEALNSAVMNLTINNSHFTASRADLIQTIANNSSTMDIVVTGTEFKNNNSAILSGGGGTLFSGGGTGSTATVTFNITGNTFRDARGHALGVFKGTGTSNFSGTISNNTVGVAGVPNSGTLDSSADISVESLGAGTMTVLISGNTLRQYNEEGIRIFANTGSSVLNATVIGNTVTEPGNIGAFSGVYAAVGGVAGDTATVNLLLGSFGTPANQNSLVGSDPTNTNDVYLENQGATTTFNLSRGGSAAGTVTGVVQDDNVGSPTVATAGTITLVAGNPPTPLLFAPGGVERALPGVETTETTSEETLPGAVPVLTGGREPTGNASAPCAVLIQTELDASVAEALRRWTATGLTGEQIATLRGLKFEVADLPGWYLGEASGDRIRVDNTAGGNGWHVDASAESDALFGTVVSSTRRYADPTGAPAGRIDLLTTILHEMGHSLGLEDSYLQQDRDSLMYGFLTQGERRLPANNQAAGAKPHAEAHPHFLGTPLTIGDLPPGKTVTITYVVTINNGLPPSVTQISNQGTVSGGNIPNVLTDDPLVVGTLDPTVTLLNFAPTFTNGPPPAGALVGTPYSFTYSATGAPAPTFSVTAGALPTGLSLSTAGAITGTPSVGGVFTGTVTATNSAGTATQNFSITAGEAPAFTNGPPPPTGSVGTAYNFTYTATGAPAPTFSVTAGALPTGLTLSSGGVISGTPSASGVFTGTVTATNAASTAAQNFSITISQPPIFTNGPPPSPATLNVAYNFTYTASGFPVPTFSVTSGALPTGLTLSSAGAITGTPTATGPFTGIVTATNSGGAPTQNFSITVIDKPTVTTPTSASVTSSSATLGGTVTADGGSIITARGVVFSKTADDSTPQIGEPNVTNLTTGGTTGVFTVNATGLTLNTAYTFAAYATNAAGTTYTSPFSTFTTPNVTFALGVSSIVEGPAAGSDTVQLSVTPETGTWTAAVTPADTWLTLAAGSDSGTGSKTVQFNFTANVGATRTGTINIAGQTFTVIQAGAPYVAANPLTNLVTAGIAELNFVTTDSAGNVYFSDRGNNLIKKWTKTTNTVSTVDFSATPFPPGGATGVAVDAAGNVYAADYVSHSIKKKTAAAGPATTVISTGLLNPFGLALDAAGDLLICDRGNNAIKKFTVSSSTVSTVVSSGLTNPDGIAVDVSGNIYIAEGGSSSVKKWTAATSTLSTLISSGLSGVHAVAVDGSGHLYIADRNNSAIKKRNAITGTVTTLVSSGLTGPQGVAVDAAGNVYIASSDLPNRGIKQLVRAFVDPTTKFVPAAAGSAALTPVLPTSTNLLAPFLPTDDQTWLSIGAISGGVVNFNFDANPTTVDRSGAITVLGQNITVTQYGQTVVSVAIGTTPVSESSATGLIYTFTRTGDPTAALPVNFTKGGTATFTTDFSASSSGTLDYSAGTLTIPAGQLSATVTLVPVDDRVVEGDETTILTVASGAGYAVSGPPATGTFTDNDTATLGFTAGTSAGLESAGTHNVETTLTINGTGTGTPGLGTALTANLTTTGGTATGSGTDYTLPISPAVTFAAGTYATGTGTQNGAVTIVDDRLVEGGETAALGLSIVQNVGTQVSIGGTTGHTLTITDNDTATLGFTSGTGTALESVGTQNAGTTLTLSTIGTGTIGLASSVTANLTTTGGTATGSGTDYTLPVSPAVTFAAGTYATGTGTQNGAVTITDDRLVEGNETAALGLSIVQNIGTQVSIGGTTGHTVTITDNDTASLSIAATATVPELAGQNVAVTLTIVGSGSGTVALATSLSADVVDLGTGTATSATDYSAFGTQTVTFIANSISGAAQNVVLGVTPDSTVETNETVKLRLQNLSTTLNGNASLGTVDSTVTITDDDTSVITLAAVSADKNEGTGGATTSFTFSATLSNPVQGGFTVAYTTNNGTASAGSDYTDNDSTLSFTGTASESKTITVLVTHDSEFEADETFNVALGAVSGLAAGINAASVTTSGSPQPGTIRNDDVLTVSITAPDNTADENGAGTGTYRVTRNSILGSTTVQLTNTGSTATAADYTLAGATFASLVPGSSGTATITAGNTFVDITLTPLVETPNPAEAAEVVKLNIATDAGYTTGSPADATVTIAPNSFLVTNTNDAGEGSLRQAILNANALVGTNTVTFSDGTAGTTDFFDGTQYAITLSSGELVVSSDMVIQGADASVLTVSGGTASRVFSVASGTATLSGLTIADGNGTGTLDPGNGGGVFNQGTLTLRNCVVLNNGVGASGQGGGIRNSVGTLTLIESTVAFNTATNGGGGVDMASGTLMVISSTVSGNASGQSGGGIRIASGSATVTNSTISGNSAALDGGGIHNLSTGLTVYDSTITGNRSDYDGNASGTGGGIGAGGTETLNNTIVAGNLRGLAPEEGQPDTSVPSDIGGGTIDTASNNLIGDAGTAGGLTHDSDGDPNAGTNNIVGNSGVGTIPISTILEPALSGNGGPTNTHTLVFGSPAINAGKNSLLPLDTFDLDGDSNTGEPLPVDQRGAGFARAFGTVDIGSVEIIDYTPGVTPATTNEDTKSTSGLVITNNASDSGRTTHYQISSIQNGTLFKNDGTTVINSGDFITKAEGAAGLKFLPGADLNSSNTALFGFSVQAADGTAADDALPGIATAAVTVTPQPDNPATSGIPDQSLAAGQARALNLTPFFSDADGNALTFSILSNSVPGIASAAMNGSNVNLQGLGAGTTLITIRADDGTGGTVDDAFLVTVGTQQPTAQQIGSAGAFNPSTGLFEVFVNVTNTMAFRIDGFRLHVNFNAYQPGFPSMRLQNASSPANSADVYVNYGSPLAVGQTVVVKLEFYTRDRQFPSPFMPILTVEYLGWNTSTLSTVANAAPGTRTGAADDRESVYYYKDTAGKISALYWNGTQWAQSTLTQMPNVADWLAFDGHYRLVYYQGTDNNLWIAFWTGSQWTQAPITTTGDVAGDVVIDQVWHIVHYRDTSNNVSAVYWNGSQWVQGPLGAPNNNVAGGLAVDSTSHLVYYKGTDNHLWAYYFNGAAWAQAQLSMTPDVGGGLTADAGGLVYYRSAADNSAWAVYWDGSQWLQAPLVATASMSDVSTLLSQNVEIYIDTQGQCRALHFANGQWVSSQLGDGGSNLTGGLSTKADSSLVFARRSDGHIVVLYYKN